jgi:hypothetical protein
MHLRRRNRIADLTRPKATSSLDRLIGQQPRLEQALARRHLTDGVLVLYDVTFDLFRGPHLRARPLRLQRDGKTGKLQIVFGLAVQSLAAAGALQLSLFDDRDLPRSTRTTTPASGRLSAATRSWPRTARKLSELLAATERELAHIQGQARKPLGGKERIGLAAGAVRDRYKVAKHFAIAITDDGLLVERITWGRQQCLGGHADRRRQVVVQPQIGELPQLALISGSSSPFGRINSLFP